MRVSLLSYKMPEVSGTEHGVFSKIPRHEKTHDKRYFETSYKTSYNNIEEKTNTHKMNDGFAGNQSEMKSIDKIKITTKLISEKYNGSIEFKFSRI
jgi:hypothetical protein